MQKHKIKRYRTNNQERRDIWVDDPLSMLFSERELILKPYLIPFLEYRGYITNGRPTIKAIIEEWARANKNGDQWNRSMLRRRMKHFVRFLREKQDREGSVGV
jgi:hypothetical protein